MNIVGISAFYHDSAACLLQDGVIKAAAQEERFTRKRHDADFPTQALDYCLRATGLSLKDVDAIAYYEKPFLKFERILEKLIEEAPFSFPLAIKALPVWMKEKLWLKKMIRRKLNADIPVLFCGHHESHAASAFFPSPFQEAAVLTVDGVGEWSTTSWGVGRGNRIELRNEIHFPHSLGLFYSAITQYLGFRVNSAEYKVMGLAPYGEPKYVDLMKNNLIEIYDDGSFLLNLEYYSFLRKAEMISPRMDALFGQKRRSPEDKLGQFHADVARSLQVVTEDIMLKLATHVQHETKAKFLCLAGGVALNCVSNGKILKNGPYENLWIQPGAGDSGGAVGAAYLAWHHYHDADRGLPMGDFQRGSFLGPDYSDAETETALQRYQVKYRKTTGTEIAEETARLLASQKVVGWFQGRMEFGPRALGNRSILGDARNPEMQKRMNLKIKFRESFRPFAPSVLAEDAQAYFDVDVISPYMLLTCSVTDGVAVKRAAGGDSWISDMLHSVPSRIPAVTHVDGSARVHTVEKKTNPLFHELLARFKSQTGSPVLINTSFNVRGEPIVCQPEDAVKCFLKTDIDALVIGNYIVEREKQDPVLLAAARAQLNETEKFELD